MPNLRVVQALTAGYEHLVDQVPPGTTLANARGLHDSSTAELALALLLAAQRELPRWVRAQEEHRWEHRAHPVAGRQPGADRRLRLDRRGAGPAAGRQ